MLSFTAAACDTTVDVTIRAPFEIVLEENPTTGYRWDLQVDPGLAIISSDFTPDAGIGIGGGGMRRFVLVAGQPGELFLNGRLWRQWLGDASATKRCKITVRVT